jgi:multimeric flavodoxin WrbA
MSKTLIIWSSTRKAGNTFKTVKEIQKHTDADNICLSDYDFGFFDYEAKNINDDFKKISKELLNYNTLIFATPVYWYSMEARMKIFFDRLSDLLSARKEDGLSLANKNTFLIANGTGEKLPEGFEIPFSLTSNYFDMNYKGAHYCYTGKDGPLKTNTWNEIETFAKEINNA